MTRGKTLLMAIVLIASCAGASAQEVGGPGAGKLEVGGFPGGGLWLGGGNDDNEVNFNTYTFGGDASWYVHPKVAVEAESAFGLGFSQNVTYQNRTVFRIQVPHTFTTTGNVVVFPGGTARRVAGYVTGGVGFFTLFSRTAASRVFGVTENENFMTTNVGGGVKIFRRGEAQNWGFRIDYRLFMVNSKSEAVPFFAQTDSRSGHRFYIGMLYTLKR